MRIPFQLVVNLHIQDTYVARWLLYDVADPYRRLHVEFRGVSRQMYQFVLSRRKDGSVTATPQQTVFVHFLQQPTVAGRASAVGENIDVVHKADGSHLTR